MEEVKKSIWNDASTVLPKVGKRVLCVGLRGGIFVGKYYSECGYTDWVNDCGMTKKVLYWTNLPYTPMEEALMAEGKNSNG